MAEQAGGGRVTAATRTTAPDPEQARGGDHLTRDTPGLGLGLALVQELLRLHGSDLEVSRADEGGTRATFRLPAVPDSSRAAMSSPRGSADDLDGVDARADLDG